MNTTLLDIYLASGSVLTIEVEDFTLTKGRIEGNIRQLDMTIPPGVQVPKFLDLTSVEAVVERAKS